MQIEKKGQLALKLYHLLLFLQPFRKKSTLVADIKCCLIVFSYSKWFYSIKLNKNTNICTKTIYFIEIWRPFWKKGPLTDIKCSSLVFSYSLLWYSIAPSDYISLNWMKIVEIQRNSTKSKTFVEIWWPFWKKRPHGFIQHWDFCRQPDFNSPMAKVSKNSGLQKSPGGCRVSVTGPQAICFMLWVDTGYGNTSVYIIKHILIVYLEVSIKLTDIIHDKGSNSL